MFSQNGLFYCIGGYFVSKHNKKYLSHKKVIISLCALLAVSFIISFTLGRYPISFKELFGILLSKIAAIFNIESNVFWSDTVERVVMNIRLPRIIIACLVGCCLSAAGASYQGVFQNSMASPDILGASSGAAFGAALAILLDMPGHLITLFAFASSLVCVLLVVFIGSKAKGKRVTSLVLSGIMISSLFSSATSFLKLIADPSDHLPTITYWLMGSFNGVEKSDVLFALIPMVIGLIPLLLLRWRINILTLGDSEAKAMGVNPGRIRLIIVLASTLVTAAAVSVSGMIGWVGLVIPHLARRLVGNNYKHLMPTTMLFGAVFMLLVDNLCRNLFSTEMPIGILTAFIGAPFFIYLLFRKNI